MYHFENEMFSARKSHDHSEDGDSLWKKFKE
jgi:hypothetical protein